MIIAKTAGLTLLESSANSVENSVAAWAAKYDFKVAWAGRGHLEMRRGSFLRALFSFRLRHAPCLVTIKWNPGHSRLAQCTYRARCPWPRSAGDRSLSNSEFSALIWTLTNGPETGGVAL